MWVNGHNLGRYWATAGPQHTLYVPAPFLRSGENEVIVLDLHGSPTDAIASTASPRYTRVGVAGGLVMGAVDWGMAATDRLLHLGFVSHFVATAMPAAAATTTAPADSTITLPVIAPSLCRRPSFECGS